MSDVDLDPEIRAVVAWLQSLGYQTTDSGDGVTKPAAGDTETLTVPHVFIRVPSYALVYQADKLWNALRGLGIQTVPAGGDGVWIQASYDPVDGSALIALYGLDDARLAVVTSNGRRSAVETGAIEDAGVTPLFHG